MCACVCVCVCVCAFCMQNIPHVQRIELGWATGLSAAVSWLRPLKPGLCQSPNVEAECARRDPCPHMLRAPPGTTNTALQTASKRPTSFLGDNEYTRKPKPYAH